MLKFPDGRVLSDASVRLRFLVIDLQFRMGGAVSTGEGWSAVIE